MSSKADMSDARWCWSRWCWSCRGTYQQHTEAGATIPVKATRRRSGSGLMPVYVHGTTAPIDNHVPEVWLSGDRNHANGRLRGVLRV